MLNKKLRDELKGAGLLDQEKVITFQLPETDSEYYSFSVGSLEYALDIASSIQVQVNSENLHYIKGIFKIIELLQAKLSKKVDFDVSVYALKNVDYRAGSYYYGNYEDAEF